MTTAIEVRPSVGLDVVVARRRAGLKQYELAQRLSISPTILCDIEHDRRVLTEELISRIVEVLSAAGGESP